MLTFDCSKGMNAKIFLEFLETQGYDASPVSSDYTDDATGFLDIMGYIASSNISNSAKDICRDVFKELAFAEAKVHNIRMEKVHFHEIGTRENFENVCKIAEIVANLGEKVQFVNITTGSGKVKFSHGEFDVPAPATKELLKKISGIKQGGDGELITPTGAALVIVLPNVEKPRAFANVLGTPKQDKEIQKLLHR